MAGTRTGSWRRHRPAWTAVGLVVMALATLALTGCPSIGARPDAADQARFARSPQWHGDHFESTQPMWSDMQGALLRILDSQPSEQPAAPVPVHATTNDPAWRTKPASGLRVTWFGHSSSLVEVDGVRVLLDPIWSARASPFSYMGPRRWFTAPATLDELAPIDAVLISHDHYDHLDRGTVLALKEARTRFIVPLGIGAHLRAWGIGADRITELDWWESTAVGPVTVHATPSRHASGRLKPQSNQTLWAGYAVIGPQHRVFYSGDTGWHDAFATVGERLGPFDLTMVESGQYDGHWPDWHLGPENAVRVHRAVRGRHFLPVHWALFDLAHHSWTEPAERTMVASARHGVDILTPMPGQPIEPTTDDPSMRRRWWPSTPWSDATVTPIVPTRDGDPGHRYDWKGN